MIYPQSIELPASLKKLSKDFPDLCEIRRLDNYFTRFDVADERTVLIKLTQRDFMGKGGSILFDNERLALHLKEIFKGFWEEAVIST